MEDAVRFHGHLCPMFALGLRMGKKALKTLERGREEGVKLVAVVEYRNCLADGLQFICGTTYGKNNLYYREYGKFAASFYDLVSGKSMRIKVRGGVVEEALEFGLKGQEIKKLPPADRKREAEEHFKRGKEVVAKLEKMSDDELFEITEAPAFEPEPEPSLEHEICGKCGEVVLKDFIKVKDGEKICIPCFRG
jgi:formylmethanofuran dehydrogenase subunit E